MIDTYPKRLSFLSRLPVPDSAIGDGDRPQLLGLLNGKGYAEPGDATPAAVFRGRYGSMRFGTGRYGGTGRW